MRNYIVINFLLLLFLVQTASAQSNSYAGMTPAEYQEFISMLVKAKKKRMAKKRALYYQQYYASQAVPPAPEPLVKTVEPNSETAEKIKALEEVQNQIRIQTQADAANKTAYDSIQIQLQSELATLRQQLTEEQALARQSKLEWQQKLEEQQIALSTPSIDTIYKERIITPPVMIANSESEKSDQLYAERHRAIQQQLSEIRFQQREQLQSNAGLKSDLVRLEERLASLGNQLNDQSSDIRSADNSKEVNRLLAELAAQKQMMQNNAAPNNDAQTKLLNERIKQLEKQNMQLMLLTQNRKSTRDTILELGGKDTLVINNATTPDSSLVLLMAKIAQLEKEAASKTDASANEVKVQRELIQTLQNRITQLEEELKKKSKPVPPVVIKPTTPKKTPIAEFVANHRQENVYFDNGSYTLNAAQREKVRTISGWMDEYELLDINVKGFASNVGSRATNERISKLRAQSVKEALVKMGVAADRIIIQPLGIDAGSIDPANARRAEIHLFVRGE